jgi:hypothetical protein
MRKTAREKLEVKNDLPKIKQAPPIWGGGRMVIVHPTEVDALIRKVRKGKLITLDEIRVVLANRHHADICCPMTAGIFVNISAAAAEEDRQAGKKRMTPYWRCLKKKGELNEKFPGGLKGHRIKLEEEGHLVVKKGKRFFVENFEKKLINIKSV